jgi:hypothetical protein
MRCSSIVVHLVASMICLVAPGSRTAKAAPATSVYASTSQTCVDLSGKQQETIGRSWRCKGPAGYSALFSDEGNVVGVELGPSGAEKNLGGLQWAGGEDAIGPEVEWRMRGGAPVAAILRIADRDENGVQRRRLLVAKVSVTGGCLIGFVDARSPRANLAARRLADRRAESFRCEDGGHGASGK